MELIVKLQIEKCRKSFNKIIEIITVGMKFFILNFTYFFFLFSFLHFALLTIRFFR